MTPRPASDEWVLLHGGALGDLALTIQLAMQLPGVSRGTVLRVLSRVSLTGLDGSRPAVVQRSTEGTGLHWLFAEPDADSRAPTLLRDSIRGARVLSALGGPGSLVHERLLELAPQRLLSLDPRPQPGLEVHITQQWRRQLQAQGVLFPRCIYEERHAQALIFPAHDSGRTDATPGRGSKCDVLIHPGGGRRAKCWPLEQFLAAAQTMQSAGLRVRYVLGPVESETWDSSDVRRLQDALPGDTCWTADELIRGLRATRLLIANDSGPAHLASLLGTPTLSLMGPTSPAVWRPLGERARLLAGDPARAPDWGIAPATVAAAARQALERA